MESVWPNVLVGVHMGLVEEDLGLRYQVRNFWHSYKHSKWIVIIFDSVILRSSFELWTHPKWPGLLQTRSSGQNYSSPFFLAGSFSLHHYFSCYLTCTLLSYFLSFIFTSVQYDPSIFHQPGASEIGCPVISTRHSPKTINKGLLGDLEAWKAHVWRKQQSYRPT